MNDSTLNTLTDTATEVASDLIDLALDNASSVSDAVIDHASDVVVPVAKYAAGKFVLTRVRTVLIATVAGFAVVKIGPMVYRTIKSRLEKGHTEEAVTEAIPIISDRTAA